MLLAAAAVLAVVSSACGPTWDNEDLGDPSGYALQAFEDVYGTAPRSTCVARVHSLRVVYESAERISAECGLLGSEGCQKYAADGSDVAYVADNHSTWVVAHEVMHMILRCETGEADVAHASDVWRLGLTSH